MCFKNNPLVKPGRICLELTNQCNLACVFCDRERLEKAGMMVNDMPDELLKKILTDIEVAYSSRDKLDTLVLVGLGEPALTRNLARHLKTISAYSHLFRNVELTSNGVSLTEAISAVLLESAVNYFTFSVNFVDRETYTEMMGKDRLDEVIRNVRNFLKLKKEKGSRALVRIQLFTESGMGKRDLEKMKSFFPDTANDSTVIFHLQPIYNKPSVQENSQSLDAVKSVKKRYPCWSMYSIVYIDIEGFVYPCTIGNDCYRKGSSLNIGNVLNKELLQVFNDDAIKKARRRAEAGQLPFAECKDCNIWTIMPNVFKYSKKKNIWEKRRAYEALIKLKNYAGPAIALLPHSVQNIFRKIYSIIVGSHNRRVN